MHSPSTKMGGKLKLRKEDFSSTVTLEWLFAVLHKLGSSSLDTLYVGTILVENGVPYAVSLFQMWS